MMILLPVPTTMMVIAASTDYNDGDNMDDDKDNDNDAGCSGGI